ncbi:hypothetical protein PIROE2DRAFT_1805 [Piromyces sp. E2]|nr:hypothetical protein PIROE2DRAFT_1805 [Piromyces sp. E2]|eukprot:OUM70124.1 hypothetical protein PIROE2DRAFT_1805 [Piromyces sp. E2]
MKFFDKLTLFSIIGSLFLHSSGNECEIAQSIFEELGEDIPDCCDGKNIICNKTNDKIIELHIEFSNKNGEIKAFPESLQLLTNLEKL